MATSKVAFQYLITVHITIIVKKNGQRCDDDDVIIIRL